MLRFPSRLLSISLVTCFDLFAAQQPPAQQAPAQTPAGRPVRPPPPTRDPNTAGYVKAKELPDGAVPSPRENGNFIIGPTHNPDPATSVKEGVPQGQVFEFT